MNTLWRTMIKRPMKLRRSTTTSAQRSNKLKTTSMNKSSKKCVLTRSFNDLMSLQSKRVVTKTSYQVEEAHRFSPGSRTSILLPRPSLLRLNHSKFKRGTPISNLSKYKLQEMSHRANTATKKISSVVSKTK